MTEPTVTASGAATADHGGNANAGIVFGDMKSEYHDHRHMHGDRPAVRRWILLAGLTVLTGGVYLLSLLHGSGPVAVLIVACVAALLVTVREFVRVQSHPDLDAVAAKLTRDIAAEQLRFHDQALAVHTAKISPADQPFTDPGPGNLPDPAGELLLQWQDIAGGAAGSLADIAAFYRAESSGRLMVLGDPGMGKTVLLSQLTLDLIAADPPGKRVPIVLDLSGFTETGGTPQEQHRYFVSWLVQSVARRYKIPPADVEALVDAGRVLPVLDGLDEMDTGTPQRAIDLLAALNHDRGPVVVTCRRAEASRIAEQGGPAGLLHDARHVVLQPLTPESVQRYLAGRFPGWSDRWDGVLAEVRHSRNLRNILCVPLYLQLAVTAYAGRDADPDELIRIPRKELRDHLLAGFVPAVHAAQAGSGGTPEQVTSWLAAIARHQRTRAAAGSGADLLSLGRMSHPHPTRALALTLLASGIALFGFLHRVTPGDVPLSIAIDVAMILVVAGLILVLEWALPLTLNRINLRAVRAKASRNRLLMLAAWSFLGSAQGLLISYLLNGTIFAVPYTVAFSLACALLPMVKGGLVVDANATSVSRLSRHSLGYSLLVGSLVSVLVTTFTGTSVPVLDNLIYFVGATIVFGLLLGQGHGWLSFFVGTRRAARHGLLPRRTAAFLDWCIDAGLLRMNGQDLQFRHQDYRDWLIRAGG